MTVPETAMNQNDCVVTGQNDIGLSGKFPVVKPITKPLAMKEFSDKKFRSRILATNAGHHLASCFWRHNISHQTAKILPLYEIAATSSPTWKTFPASPHQFPLPRSHSSMYSRHAVAAASRLCTLAVRFGLGAAYCPWSGFPVELSIVVYIKSFSFQ